jgi:succinoglycan biosynthesis transport protein ExoP
VRKRRWTVLACFILTFALIALATLKETPLYEAKATLEIEKENPNIVTAQDLFEVDNASNAFLETQYKVLESESLSRRVIRDLHLDELPEFNPPRHWWSGELQSVPPAATSARPKPGVPQPDTDAVRNALKRFKDQLNIDPVKQSRIVELTFASEDPGLSASIINDLALNYIDRNLELRWDAAQKASEWISQQLVGLKGRLEKSEDDMQRYTRENGLLFLESEKGATENMVDARLRQLQEELTRAQASRIEKESLFRLVRAGDSGALPTVFENRELQDLTLRISELRTQDALLGSTFSVDYPKRIQLQSQIDEAQRLLDQERERAAMRIQNDYLAANRRETMLRQAFADAQGDANHIAEKSVQYNILKREVDTNRGLYEGLLERLKQAGVSAGLKESNIRIVDAAVPPKYPAKPRVLLNLSLGVLVGLSVGIGAAFLQEHSDNSIKTTEDIERILQLPALAMVPAVESLKGHANGNYGSLSARGRALLHGANGNGKLAPPRWYRIDDLASQHSVLAEAIRGLRTSVLLSAAGRPPRSLLVSSAQPGEGKTTIAVNLAISLAQLGQRVLLIDGDLRQPSVHRAFQIKGSLGMASYLAGQQDWRTAIERTTVSELDLLVAGPVSPNPAELLSSDRMKSLIHEALGEYKFVVIDSPPLLNVADSRVLATLVEAVVLVVKGGVTPRTLVRRAHAYAAGVGGRMIGVVLNNVDLHHDEYSDYRYYSYKSYGAASPDVGASS